MRRISDKGQIYLAVDQGHISMMIPLDREERRSMISSIGRKGRIGGMNGFIRQKAAKVCISDSDVKELTALLTSRISISKEGERELSAIISIILSAKFNAGD